MSILLDTNIITRLAQQTHPHHEVSKAAIGILRERGEALHIVPQNIYEFWAVATRPIHPGNGLGLTVAEAKSELRRICALFAMLPDTAAIYTEWARLVEIYEVKGKISHDARLAAAMMVHGVTGILTFNDRDFSRHPNIRVRNPMTLTPALQL